MKSMTTRFHRLKQAAGVIVSAIGICACAVALYVNFAPQFGAQPQGEHLVNISASVHFQNGAFVNQVETIMDYGLLKTAKMIRDLLTLDNISPTGSLPVKFAAGNPVVAVDTLTSVSGTAIAPFCSKWKVNACYSTRPSGRLLPRSRLSANDTPTRNRSTWGNLPRTTP